MVKTSIFRKITRSLICVCLKSYTQEPLGTNTLGVRDLVDKNNGCWNQDIISNTFYPIDKEEITKAPLYHLDKDDWLI